MFNRASPLALIQSIAPYLIKNYGVKESYTLSEVTQTIQELKLGKQSKIHYVFALLCKAQDFYKKFNHNNYDYISLQAEISKKLFKSETIISTSMLLKLCNEDHFEEPSNSSSILELNFETLYNEDTNTIDSAASSDSTGD